MDGFVNVVHRVALTIVLRLGGAAVVSTLWCFAGVGWCSGYVGGSLQRLWNCNHDPATGQAATAPMGQAVTALLRRLYLHLGGASRNGR